MSTRLLFLLFGACALLASACQDVVQPTDLVRERAVTVEVRRRTGEPITDASILWTKTTGTSAPTSGIDRTGDDGFAILEIPGIAVARDSVAMVIEPPLLPSVAVRMAVCADTLIKIRIDSTVRCGTTTLADTIVLDACPADGNGVVSECRYYPTDCPTGLDVTADSAADDGIRLQPTGSARPPAVMGVCVQFDAVAAGGNRTVTRRLRARTTGTGQPSVEIALTIIGRVNCEPCPCPAFPPATLQAPPVCVGSTATVSLPLSTLFPVVDGTSDCLYDFALAAPAGDGRFDLGSATSLSVRGGSRLPDVAVRVTPQQAGDIVTTFEWRITPRRGSSVGTACPQTARVTVTIPVLVPNCVLLTPTADTLQRCVFADTASTTTVELRNDGDCPVTVDVATGTSVFSVSPSGSVTIPPRATRRLTVSFTAEKRDWDNNPAPATGAKGAKFFQDQLSIRGCLVADIPLGGHATIQCNAFKYQCLRQFRPPGYPDVYAESIQLVEDKTTITYQNDNQAFKVYDIYVRSITAAGGSYTIELASGNGQNSQPYGSFQRILGGFAVAPGQSICDTYPASAVAACDAVRSSPASGQTVLGGLVEGDVVLYVKDGSTGPQCALIWIQSVGPDRPGTNFLPVACIEICYPMFVQ